MTSAETATMVQTAAMARTARTATMVEMGAGALVETGVARKVVKLPQRDEARRARPRFFIQAVRPSTSHIVALVADVRNNQLVAIRPLAARRLSRTASPVR